jgi:hypothetical protein
VNTIVQTNTLSNNVVQTLVNTPTTTLFAPPPIPPATSGVVTNNIAGVGGLSGGLAFIEAPSQAGTNGISPTIVTNSGVDASGFMRVSVIGGGINLPTQANSNAVQNTSTVTTPATNNQPTTQGQKNTQEEQN